MAVVNLIGIVAAVYRVVAGKVILHDVVVTYAATDDLAACACMDDIIAGIAIQGGAVHAANQGIVAGSAVQDVTA